MFGLKTTIVKQVWVQARLVTHCMDVLLQDCYQCRHNHNTTSDLLIGQLFQMRQADPGVVTALTHRPWSLSRYGDGTPCSVSAWTNYWLGVLDVLLDWAHHHLLWNLCGVSAILMQKDFISL